MEYHQLKLMLESPPVKLLRAQNAPLILAFLHRLFKQEHRVAIPEGQLRAALEAELEERREAEPLAYAQTASDYLAQWCHDSQGFLRRYYGPGSDEPLYELTSGSEKALLWLESLRESRFVGTESRLESIFVELETILEQASSDPDERIRKLEEKVAAMRADIDRIRATGHVTSFTPVQINERYARVLATARELLGDFRQVEENFKRIAREIAERHAQPGITKGAIVGHMLDSHDALRASEQGQSFFAFWELLLSPERQGRFQEAVTAASALSSLDDENRQNRLLRHFLSRLLRESETVVESHQRMSANLRRVLDTRHLSERRRLGELLQEIRQAALAVREQPPTEEDFFAVEGFPDVFASLARPLWQAPESILSDNVVEMEVNELSLEDLRRFRNLPQIRLQELRRNVEACLARDYTVTLQQVLDAFTPRHGIMEVIGYLVVASNDARHFVGEDSEVIELPPPSHQRWRMPRVLFCKG
ncbi:MAG TPA: DUF3375 domain-containing protein [Verrucomicrobiae bacterium]